MNLKRIVTLIGGAATVAASLGDVLPGWAGALGGLVAGAAVNAERLMAKRGTPSNPFSTVDAEDKLRKMRGR